MAPHPIEAYPASQVHAPLRVPAHSNGKSET
jgi:hypothetical protein